MGASAYSLTRFTGLALLLPALATALYCELLQHQQQMLNSQILQLLAKQSPAIPPECLAQMTTFNFPGKNLKVGQLQLARRVIYEILRGYLGLLSSGLVKTGLATTVQERLLNDLHAQSARIEKCFGEEKTEPRSPDERPNKLMLLRYFQRIRTFLQEKSHSPCAGITLQIEVRTCLTYLDMLTNRMNS